MNQKPIPIPQLGAATALVQLLTENPHLPLVDWSLPENGGPLAGIVINDSVDMRPIIAAYAEVLGGRVSEFEYERQPDGERRYSATLFATWRDVRVMVKGICAAAAHVAVAA